MAYFKDTKVKISSAISSVGARTICLPPDVIDVVEDKVLDVEDDVLDIDDEVDSDVLVHEIA